MCQLCHTDNGYSVCRYAFLAFGQGPRSCIAMRFALYEAKVALVSVVRKYRLSRTPNTPEKLHFDPRSNMTESLHPLWVKVEERRLQEVKVYNQR